MSSPLITINSDSSPATADDTMLQKNVRHLLVVDDKTDINKPIGIITPRDFTRYRNTQLMRIKIPLKRY